ncbi:MAG TPA: adenylosuccinate lyase, partial [Verrucomicrobiae bacterium]|nr:adenylosuccinate lyase [Verrucomicrobiae bacterium]
NSQRVLLALVDKGMTRQEAYGIVQAVAFKAWEQGLDFCNLIKESAQVSALLSPAEIDDLFDYEYHLKHIDLIFERLGLA